MKKTIAILSFITLIIACNNNSSTETNSQTAIGKEDPEAVKGLELVAKSDCFTCHKVADKLTGPAYTAVAEKYPDNEKSIDFLAEKIRKGGSGNWGAIAMLPHPDISEADARTMAKYVLSVK